MLADTRMLDERNIGMKICGSLRHLLEFHVKHMCILVENSAISI